MLSNWLVMATMSPLMMRAPKVYLLYVSPSMVTGLVADRGPITGVGSPAGHHDERCILSHPAVPVMRARSMQLLRWSC